jgi:acetyl esterase/lipase
MWRDQLEEYLSLLPLAARVIPANLCSTDTRRIEYGNDSHQYVLFYEPPAGIERRQTGILFIHGGGWRRGFPAAFRFVGEFFARLGFSTLLVGYRLAPAALFPAQLEDVYDGSQAGVRVLNELGTAPRQWILGGQSAGAHLAALLAYADPARCEAIFGRPAGLFLVSGPLDFSACASGEVSRLIDNFTGGEVNRQKADPIRYVRGDEGLTVLCIHGDRDPLVPLQNSLAFAQKAGPSARVYIAEGWHHSDLANFFIDPNLPASQALVDWLESL